MDIAHKTFISGDMIYRYIYFFQELGVLDIDKFNAFTIKSLIVDIRPHQGHEGKTEENS